MDELNPGPFAPVVGYVGALLATAYLIGMLWRGRRVSWIGPEENVPHAAARIVGVLSAVGIVILWLYAEPQTMSTVVKIALISSGVLVGAFIGYSYLKGALIFSKRVANSPTSTADVPVVGGFWLTAQARATQRNTKETVQEILEGSAFNVDAIWSRNSRESAKATLLLLYLATMVSGTIAMSAGGFATQVRLTGKPASAVIRSEDAPGSTSEVPIPQVNDTTSSR